MRSASRMLVLGSLQPDSSRCTGRFDECFAELAAFSGANNRVFTNNDGVEEQETTLKWFAKINQQKRGAKRSYVANPDSCTSRC